ncbi:MAG TPA: nicotinate (nicotinamide) nucleotide adenylyltransferase [Firmicutes bacterium]|nr:nicotinate (nicotinamide) nucleotide adenylyltransferase [Bacillota bacterium]
MSYILFGGTFDPIHFGHINIAKFALEKLSADKVIFIPSKNPRWKDPISSADRLNMINIALSGEKDFIISHFELDSTEPVNYSIDTIEHFVKLYPNEKLYFLIGFDQVDNLDRWHEIDKISKLVQIVAISRPSYPYNHELLKRYNVQVIQGKEYDVSSTDIRTLKSLYTPRGVIDYIVDHKLYFTKSVEAYMSSSRFLHSVSTAKLAYDIASSNGLDPTIAYIAGLIHDIAKERSDLKEIMEKHYPQYINMPSFIYHQFAGEYIARTFFKIDDERILEAIRVHTTGDRAMGKYAKILYAADKIEPTRNFDSKSLIEAMKSNLTSGFREVLKAQIEYYKSKNIDYSNNMQMRCFTYYLKEER